MTNKLSEMVAGLSLLLLTHTSGMAAERLTLHTHVPESAARLPRIERLPGVK